MEPLVRQGLFLFLYLVTKGSNFFHNVYRPITVCCILYIHFIFCFKTSPTYFPYTSSVYGNNKGEVEEEVTKCEMQL